MTVSAGAALAPRFAQAQSAGVPYISLGAGVNLQQNEIIQPAPSYGVPHSHFESFHPGFAGQASVGYGLGYGFRAEIEGDFFDNVVSGYGPNPNRRAGGVEQKYGGMLNVLHDFYFGAPIVPYLGIGAGGQEVDHLHFNQSTAGFVFPSHPEGNQTVGAFAYQGIAGFAVPVPFVPGLALTAEYRFLGLLDPLPAFHVESYSGDSTVGRLETRKWGNDFNHSIMLGVRYALFPPPPPPPPPPMPQPAQSAVPAPQPSRTYLVFFDWDRSDLTARARSIISEAAQASTRVQTTRIAVNGYTDLSGTAAYNQQLSLRRAQSVQAELLRDGVPGSEIVIRGYGETHPLVPTAQGVREPQNRRVEIILG